MNSGFLLFDVDIEMGDENVFNTTGSRLWQRIVYLFQAELKAEYTLMRQGRFTVENIMKYLYGEQISQIPATYYNHDMQTKYLNFGSSYLYALHGSGEKHIKRWIRERLMYVDTLLGYMVSSADYITLRSNKLGYVYLDIQMYQPMYVTVKWRDEANNTGIQTKRVGKGETVRFDYTMPTATDQEILVYAGHQIKSLGDLSNLQPSTLLIANADRLTELVCHSPNLINTDLSECKMLQKIDISDCSALGTGIGAQPILNIQNAKYLRYLDTRNTQLTAIYTMQAGSNLEEIYYPKTIQTVDLMNQAYLRIVGIPYEEDENGKPIYCESLADIIIDTCKNVEYLCYPYEEGEYVSLKAIKQVQNLTLIDSLDRLESMSFNGFNKLKSLTLSTMHNITSLGFNDMIKISEEPTLEAVRASDCPLIDKVSFNISNSNYKVEFVEGAKIDLGGMQSVKTIESNASIKGLKTLIIPLSTKELRFIPGYGDGTNSIVSIWSASSNHANDNYEGMDLQDISLSYLDMTKLNSITKAINFHIAPTDQHPNMNTSRTGNYFKPEGSLDLTNYTGSMVAMLKGVDLSLLDVIINDTQSQTDLSSLFEGADIQSNQIDKINNILDKYNMSTNWTNMFKDTNISVNPSNIHIPGENSYREMNLEGMFKNTNVSDDIVITKNIRNITSMFENCKSMVMYKENWNKNYDNLLTEKCYAGTGGNLEVIPVPWGGYGFFDDVTSEIVIVVPKDEYNVVLANRHKVTSYGLVNWGDGVVDILTDNQYSHTYEKAGVYTVKGHFTFGNGYLCNTSLNGILVEVKHIASATTNLSQAFKYCSTLNKVNLNGLNVDSFNETFNSCWALTEVICDKIQTDNLTSINALFMGCSKLESIDISNFNTTNVREMKNVFNGCSELIEINVEGIDTSNVLSMDGMFSGCSKIQELNLSSFDTRLVMSMSNMFYDCAELIDLDVSNFNTAIVESMANMFSGCTRIINLDLSNFVTSNVESMAGMFYNCISLSTLDISKFTTDSATDLSSMFYNCPNLLTLDLSKFNTEKVKNMNSMFHSCAKLANLNVSNFNTENVENMYSMFYGCRSLNELDLSKFNTAKVTNIANMFYECESIVELNLSKFVTTEINSMSSLFYGCRSLTKLNIESFDTKNVENMTNMFHNCSGLKTLDLRHFDTSKVNDMSYMFYNCTGLTSLYVDNFDTTNVNTMYGMFYGCKLLTSINVSKFNTANVDNIGSMFNRCESLTSLDLSSFNTSKVVTMASLFYNCRALMNLNISSFNTTNVKDMSYMFNNCTSLLGLDLSHFITPNLTNMAAMFYNCQGLTYIKLDKFDTSNVTTMSNLFYNCSSLLSIDLSSFNTPKLENMSGLFNSCVSLTDININHFITDNVVNMSSVFTGCSCDVIFTNKNTEKVTTVFAMFNVYYGEKIDLSGISLKNSKNNNSFITVAHNLVDFIAPYDICEDITITADELSIESLMSIINNLSDVVKPKVLEIGANNIAKLTPEQIAVAIDKNWTVC